MAGKAWRAILAGLALTMAGVAAAAPMAWPALLTRAHPAGAVRIAYGAGPLQFGELWLPPTPGPHHVVIMVHGGCWQTDVADRSIMDWAAADLARRGFAVWNIEYAGVDRPGGGYPGTFRDAAAAADALRRIAPKYRLRLDRVVAFGHSAGGHLALWLAARPRLPAGSTLRTRGPLPIHAVVAAGALPDLEAARTLPGNDCGATGVPRLVGRPRPGRADVYADTSLPALLPLGVRQTLVNGALDRIAPPSLARSYVAQAQAKGETVAYVEVPDAGHVELIAPETRAWAMEVAAIAAGFRE